MTTHLSKLERDFCERIGGSSGPGAFGADDFARQRGNAFPVLRSVRADADPRTNPLSPDNQHRPVKTFNPFEPNGATPAKTRKNDDVSTTDDVEADETMLSTRLAKLLGFDIDRIKDCAKLARADDTDVAGDDDLSAFARKLATYLGCEESDLADALKKCGQDPRTYGDDTGNDPPDASDNDDDGPPSVPDDARGVPTARQTFADIRAIQRRLATGEW